MLLVELVAVSTGEGIYFVTGTAPSNVDMAHAEEDGRTLTHLVLAGNNFYHWLFAATEVVMSHMVLRTWVEPPKKKKKQINKSKKLK